MKKILPALVLFVCICQTSFSQITIAEARVLPGGSVVTVKGLVLNGSELGDIRYIQDNTGNIAAYAPTILDVVLRGDSIQVTGPLFNYNGLLEISTATSVTVLNSGNPLPAPTDVTCISGYVEGYEAKLVRVNAALFADAGTFSTAGSGTNYDISDAAGTAEIRVVTTTNIDGTPIPVEEVSITGIMSQFAPGGTGGYQLLPRDLSDISTGGNPPVISSTLTQTAITTSSFTVNFNTVNDGNTIIYYGLTTALGSVASDATLTTTHALDLTGLTAGTIYYVKAASVSVTNDTSNSAIAAMATASNSTGQIKVWFNNTVDNSVSTGTNAVFVNGSMDDTIINILDHALYSVDICIYNIDNINNLITAINDAYARGVDVRVICDSGVDDFNYNAIVIGPGKKKKSPPDGSTNADGAFFGIMHNKFINIDAVSTDPDEPWVITGSMNYTDDQVKVDKQNIIAIQDQSLSKAYKAEFDEMFAGNFGPDKTNNTPHEFMIGGKRVELYFSPSDEPETRLIEKINTADFDLHFAVFSLTRFSISYAIEDAVYERGVFASGIWDQTDASDSTAVNVLEDALGDRFFNYSSSNLLHHKYLLVDANCPQSDPLVWTGSHNWSSSANSRNDENSLVIHDSTTVNLYYQEYMQRYKDEGATEFVVDRCDFVDVTENEIASSIHLYPNPASQFVTVQIPELSGKGVIFIYDFTGKLILTQDAKGEFETINIGELRSGMYLVVVRNENDNWTTNFIKTY
ncbi:MAG: T9SS type A sorting domain-containing protein [Chitinophagales bacterium]|nr:T9SS type A sorting domain-containing protein [Chitinophagales bacterium]